MATLFPTQLDNFNNPTPTDSMETVDHSGQHSNANDAIEAIQAKIGVNGSTDENSLDYKINHISSPMNYGLLNTQINQLGGSF